MILVANECLLIYFTIAFHITIADPQAKKSKVAPRQRQVKGHSVINPGSKRLAIGLVSAFLPITTLIEELVQILGTT